jgi:hypothetical protein
VDLLMFAAAAAAKHPPGVFEDLPGCPAAGSPVDGVLDLAARHRSEQLAPAVPAGLDQLLQHIWVGRQLRLRALQMF